MIEYLFPIPVYIDCNRQYIDTCENLFNLCPNFGEGPDKVITTLKSYNPMKADVTWNVLNLEITADFVGFIKSSTKKYIIENNLCNNYEVSVINLWLNRSSSRINETDIHCHYGYTYSGVYYVSTPGDSGKIKFYYEHMSGFNHTLTKIKEFTPSNSSSWWIPVSEGTIVLFPSWLKHSVPPFSGNGFRETIAFDIICR
jgi:uncharacterized protein (TIGR02466 family)